MQPSVLKGDQVVLDFCCEILRYLFISKSPSCSYCYRVQLCGSWHRAGKDVVTLYLTFNELFLVGSRYVFCIAGLVCLHSLHCLCPSSISLSGFFMFKFLEVLPNRSFLLSAAYSMLSWIFAVQTVDICVCRESFKLNR